jgi:Domain of unknown function (DUF4384)
MLIPLLMLAFQNPAIPIATQPVYHNDPPVHVWFNSDGNYHFGDRAKVYAKTAKDGNLVVLRADDDGHVSAVFPLDPQGDQHVKGGKKYELKGRGDREAFVVGDTIGRGTVLAAYSETPFRFDQFAKDGHWDTAALSGQGPAYSANAPNMADPEARLRDLVQQMQPNQGHFDYDVATYVVGASAQYATVYADPYLYGGWPWWGWGFGFGPGPFVGPRVFFAPRVFVGPHFHSGFHGPVHPGFHSGFHEGFHGAGFHGGGFHGGGFHGGGHR